MSGMVYVALFVGYVLQVLLRIGPSRITKRKILYGFLISIPLGVLAGSYAYDDSDAADPQAYEVLAWMCFGFSLSISIYLRKYLLQTIGPALFLIWGMLFCYVVATQAQLFFLALGVACLIFGLLACFTALDGIKYVKLALYVLYLGLVCGVTVFGSQIIVENWQTIFLPGSITGLDLATAFLFGMALSVVGLNAAFIYTLLPSKHDTAEDIQKTIALYVTNYREEISKSQLYIIIGIAILLIVNLQYDLLDNTLFLPLAITLSQLFSHRLPTVIATSTQKPGKRHAGTSVS